MYRQCGPRVYKIPLLPQTEKDEMEEGRKVNKETNDQTEISINQIHEMLEYFCNSSIKSWTIFKVNVKLRESNPDAYTPKIVSIGPYHMENPQLFGMEKYKVLYLQRFLQRKEGVDVRSCIRKLEKLKEDALKCYEDIEDLNTAEFFRMLLLDSCFVVEFIRERCGMCPNGEDRIVYDNNESYIFRDLMLLENQLPFFVLNKLHRMTMQDNELPLAIQVNKLFIFFVDLPKKICASFRGREYYNAGNIKHLLHAVHMLSCHSRSLMKKSKLDDTTYHKVMANATELSEAGVSFTKVKNIKASVFDIKFENGLMAIPSFGIFSYTETLLRNLIAYEQQSRDVQLKYFSDFATFMDYLIDSDKDVNLLRRKGIIVNFIGEDKEVASLFNQIGSGVTMYSNFYYKEEFRKAVEHCEKPWNRMKANLKHNYFSTPWAGASTVAAIILLILTTIQTFLAFTGPLKK